jgi:hypothetical protein
VGLLSLLAFCSSEGKPRGGGVSVEEKIGGIGQRDRGTVGGAVTTRRPESLRARICR